MLRWQPAYFHIILSLLTIAFVGCAQCAQNSETAPDATAEHQLQLSEQLALFSRDLEQTRCFMGVPQVSPVDLGIRKPLLRDLYAQILVTWKKANRLLFEIKSLNGISQNSPPINDDGADTLNRLRDAHQMLRQVMEALPIAPFTEPMPAAVPKSNAEIFDEVVRVNRQLDLMLERRPSPIDIFQELSLGIGYSARLLSRYPRAIRIPLEPPFEPGKQPKEVYSRLINCLQIIIRIFNTLNLPILQIDTPQTSVDLLKPSDVYLVATIIIVQLDVLYQHLGIDKRPLQPIYPGPKFPSHNYQRAGILEAQLQQLQGLISTDLSLSIPPARSP